jgi:hypothetical protein
MAADPTYYGQSVTPYATKSADAYRDQARRRALADAVQGGGQPLQTSLQANQPYNYPSPGGPPGAAPGISGPGGGRPAVRPERRELAPRAGDASAAAAAMPATQKAAAQPANLPQYGGQTSPWVNRGINPNGGYYDTNAGKMVPPGGGDYSRRVRPFKYRPPGEEPSADTPPAQEGPAATAGPAAGTYQTKLMEGDPAKLADPAHAAKSPKYDFLQLAQSGKYNYDQMGDMVGALKSGANGRLWQGWNADGKGNLVFQGDPGQLAPEWNGVTRVDAVGSYGNMAQGKDPQGWRWGVDDPNAPSGAATGGLVGAGGAGGALGGATAGPFGMQRWMSNNTQTGGDALQAIYAMLPGLMGDLGKGSAIDNLTSYWSKGGS